MYEVNDKKDNFYNECRVRQRSDGTYEAKYIAGIDPVTGKAIHGTVCGETPDEACEKMAAAIAAGEACKMAFEEWLKIWEPDVWHTRTYSRKLLAVKSASSKLQAMQDIRRQSEYYTLPLIFEVTPEMLAAPEGLALEDIRNLVKP